MFTILSYIIVVFHVYIYILSFYYHIMICYHLYVYNQMYCHM